MSKKYYIDESGNTGDLVVSKENSNFSAQEYFTLACISLNDSEQKKLEEFITNLKAKYKIQSPELKFSRMKGLLGKKIGFMLELLRYLEGESDFIIEIVDKKYLICTNIVNCLINTPYDEPNLGDLDACELELMKLNHHYLCQWVYDKVTLEFLIKFTDISRNPSEDGLSELFEDILSLAKSFDDPDTEKVRIYIEKSIDTFEKFKLYNEKNPKDWSREPFTYFLPIPDKGKKDQLIGILPYIGNFNNILGRLNKLHNRDLSNVVIIHDNQAHFDEILKSYHESVVDNTNKYSVTFDHSDFYFLNQSSLEFCDDKDQIGLQVADLFAGFVTKGIPYILKNENTLNKKEATILLTILVSLYRIQSINYVIPPKHYESLFYSFDQIVCFERNMKNLGFCMKDFEKDLLET